jgi:hypothetical protein
MLAGQELESAMAVALGSAGWQGPTPTLILPEMAIDHS